VRAAGLRGGNQLAVRWCRFQVFHAGRMTPPLLTEWLADVEPILSGSRMVRSGQARRR
jgi:hypothetical protein